MENGTRRRTARADKKRKTHQQRRIRLLLVAVLAVLLGGAYFFDRTVTLRAGEEPAREPQPPVLADAEHTGVPTLPPADSTAAPTEAPLALSGWAESASVNWDRTVPYGTPQAALGLPMTLVAEIAGEQGGSLEVPVRWVSTPAYDPYRAQDYLFTAQAADADEEEPYWAELIAPLDAPRRRVTVLQSPRVEATPDPAPTEAPTAPPTEAPTETPTEAPTPTPPPSPAPEEDDSFFTPPPTEAPTAAPTPAAESLAAEPTGTPALPHIIDIEPLPEVLRQLTVEPGTPMEALGLPETLQVILSAGTDTEASFAYAEGERQAAPVTWRADPPYDPADTTPAEEYLLTPDFGPAYALDRYAVVPEARLRLLPAAGGMGIGNVFDDGVLAYTVQDEDADSRTGTVAVRALVPETLSGSLEVPEQVTARGYDYTVDTIARDGFRGAAGIQALWLPGSLTRIGASAFEGCDALAELHTGLWDLAGVRDSAFTQAQKERILVTCPQGAEAAYLAYGFQHVNVGVYPDIEAEASHINTGEDLTLTISLGGAPGTALDAGILQLGENAELVAFHHEAGEEAATAVVRLTGDGMLAVDLPAGAYVIDGMANAADFLRLPQGPLVFTRMGSGQAQVTARSSGITGSIEVPGEIRQDDAVLRVTRVGYAGFQGAAITGISLPDSIDAIAAYAFEGCGRLRNITLHAVRSIGGYAFAGCDSIETIQSDMRDLSGVQQTAFPRRVLRHALVACDLDVAHLYRNFGFLRIAPETFTPKLSTDVPGIEAGKVFELTIDLGCAMEAGLTQDILTVTGGEVVDFYYAPFRRDTRNLVRPHPTTVLASARILPDTDTVRVSIEEGAFSFYETGNSAGNALELTRPQATVKQMAAVPESLEHDGGSVTVTLTGVGLTDSSLELLLDGQPQARRTATDDAAALTLEIPANDTKTPVRHTIALLLDGGETGLTREVRVAARPPASISGLSVLPQQLPGGGGTVTLSVTGDSLLAARSVGVSVNGQQTQVLAVMSDTLAEADFALPQNVTSMARSYAFTALLDDLPTPYIRSVTVASPGTDLEAGTPEYRYIHTYDARGLVLHSTDIAAALPGAGGLHSVGVATGGGAAEHSIALRALEELLKADKGGQGALDLVGAGYRLRIPLRVLEKKQTKAALAAKEPAKPLPGLEGLDTESLRLRVRVKAVGDGYDVTLALYREDAEEPVEGLDLPRLGHPLVLSAPDGHGEIEVYESGHYAADWGD